MPAFRSVRDPIATGHKLRVPVVVDTYSRLSPVPDARMTYRGDDEVRTLGEACRRLGYRKTIRVDQDIPGGGGVAATLHFAT